VLSVVVTVIRDRIADVAPALAMRTVAVLVDQPTERLATFQSRRWKQRQWC